MVAANSQVCPTFQEKSVTTAEPVPAMAFVAGAAKKAYLLVSYFV